MEYDDPRWVGLQGGYRIPYDPRNALHSLEANTKVEKVWEELWTELHHQGDVGEASYATIPLLARIHMARGVPDWNTYAFAVIVEEARHRIGNPPIPSWLNASYQAAWQQLVELAFRDLQNATDPLLVSSTIAAIAVGKGQLTLGRIAAMFTEDERRDLLDRAFRYRDSGDHQAR
jgi:hypothetical protein